MTSTTAIRRIDLRTAGTGTGAGHHDYRAVLPRADFDVEAATAVVRPICEAVRERGEDAVREFSAQLDGVEQERLTVPAEAMDTALAGLDPAVRAGLEESIRRLRTTCEAELEGDVVSDLGPGA